MIRRLPIIPTLFVLAAAAAMVGLGVWQLQRAEWKADLIARYEAALISDSKRPFPVDQGGALKEDDLFHQTAFECTGILDRQAIAGRNADDRAGFAQIVRCQTGRGPADVRLGWSARPEFADYEGGPVVGLIAPGGADGARVQATPPLAGLQPLAKPDPKDLPNNHLAYAGQWFFFAFTALLIYALALRKRWQSQD